GSSDPRPAASERRSDPGGRGSRADAHRAPAETAGARRRGRRATARSRLTRFGELLVALTREPAEFIVVGGVALVSRGGSRLTNDLDLVYERSQENLERLVRAI